MSARVSGFSVLTVTCLVLISACAGAAPIADSPEAREEKARAIVRLEIENGGLDERLDRGAELARAYSLDALKLELGRELTVDEQQAVLEIMRSVLGEYLTAEAWEGLLTEVYAGNFTAAELQEILAFFESPAGRKTLDLSDQLSAEIDEQADAMFEGRIDEFANRVDEELAKRFPALQQDDAR